MKMKYRNLHLMLLVSSGLLLAGCDDGPATSEQIQPFLDRSQVYSEQGQYRAAMIELRNAIQRDPATVEPVIALADTLLLAGANRQASDLLEPWLETETDTVSLSLADAYLRQGKHVSAREVLTLYPADSGQASDRYWQLMGDTERLSNSPEVAMEAYEEALSLDPGNARALIGKARLLLAQNQRQEAMETMQNWLDDQGDHPQVLLLVGQMHYEENRLELSSNVLTNALDALSDSDIFLPERRQILEQMVRTLTDQGRHSQAMVYNRLLSSHTNVTLSQGIDSALDAITRGDLTTARITLEDLIRQHPDSQFANLLLGSISLQEGDSASALPLLVDNLDAETTPTPLIRLATLAQIDQGKRQQALQTLERALMARPNDPELLAMHGILAISDPKRSAEGITSINRALQLEPSRTRLRLALAEYHTDRGETEKAIEQLRQAFADNPTDWPITDYYVTRLLDSNRRTEAQTVRSKLLSEHSQQPYANVLIALIDYNNGDVNAALSRLERYGAMEPDWVTPMLALARMYRSENRPDDAIKAYLEAAQRDPERITALQEAGQLYAREHTPDEVIAWLTEVSEKQAELSPAADALAAQIHLQRNQPSQAQDRLASHRDSDHLYVRAVRADSLSIQARQAAVEGDRDRARTLVGEAISLQPDNPSHQLLLVRLIAAEGSLDTARSVLEGIQSQYGPSTEVALTRSQLQLSQENSESAYAELLEYWQDSRDLGVMSELIALARAVDPTAARELAENWTGMAPNSALAWRSAGETYLLQGDDQSAAAAYQTLLELQPDSLIALNNLAWSLRENDTERALELASEAAERAPDNADIQDTYGWILHLSGDHERAMEKLRQALELAPDNEVIRTHLTQVEEMN